jgi:hypothetical protein
MKDPECKRTMLDIAQSYEYLAAAAQKRLDQSK